MSKAQILDHVWEYDFGGDGGVVETYIGYLRRKLDTVEPRLIHTIRGVGYTLRAPQLSGAVSLRARLLARHGPHRARAGRLGRRDRPHDPSRTSSTRSTRSSQDASPQPASDGRPPGNPATARPDPPPR